MDDGPRLPEGVTLKRVPGMRIDFAEYQALARAALVRARQKGATPDLTEAGVEELLKATLDAAVKMKAVRPRASSPFIGRARFCTARMRRSTTAT